MREGRTGAQLLKSHLVAVFTAVGKKVPDGRMEDLVEPAQEIVRFDKQTRTFPATMMWDERENIWKFLVPQA